MTNELLARIRKLEEFATETRGRFLSSKRCAGCIFVDNFLKSEDLDGLTAPNRRSKENIVRVLSLNLQAAECRGISVYDAFLALSPTNETNVTNVMPKNQSVQTEKFTNFDNNRTNAYSQTCISASYFNEIDRFRRWVKSNESNFTRWSLEQLSKFSATEKERENAFVMLQFAKLLLQIEDDQLESYYKEYLSGKSPNDLRRHLMESQMKSSLSTSEDHGEKLVEQAAKRQKTDASQEGCHESQQVQKLSNQLNHAKVIITDVVRFICYAQDEIENSEDSFVRLLGMFKQYTEVLHGRRNSV